MRVVPVALALALAALGAGCGSERSIPRPDRPEWTPGPACVRGGPACVTAVIAEMTRRYDRLAATCDHNAPFALMYLRVTEAVGNGEKHPGEFVEGAYLARLDAVFAMFYFDAIDAWRSGRRAAVPDAWKIAFELAERRRVSGLGDLLLGMNAHISRDLPFAVARMGLQQVSSSGARTSFEQVNGILERVSEPMLHEVARRFDPTVADFTLPVLATNTRNLGLLLGRWRDDALRNADRLLKARTAKQHAVVARSIEETAVARAVVIAAATSRVPFSKAGHARDAYCGSH